MSRISRVLIASLLINKPTYVNNRSITSRTSIKMCSDSDKIDYFEMTVRNTKLCANILAKHDPPCPYCNGGGYLDCDSCTKGCWRCKSSKIKECPFCKGDGRGRPAYSRLPVKK